MDSPKIKRLGLSWNNFREKILKGESESLEKILIHRERTKIWKKEVVLSFKVIGYSRGAFFRFI
jgi:hypothetical protein